MASRVAVPVPLPFYNPFNASWSSMPLFNWLFTTTKNTFHFIYTILMPRYPPFPFERKTVVDQVISSGKVHYAKSSCIICTTNPHRHLTKLFFLETSLIDPFRQSSIVCNGLPYILPRAPLTAYAIYSSSGTPCSNYPIHTSRSKGCNFNIRHL